MRPNLNADELSQKLAVGGLRHTPQRELVYSVLLDQLDHPTADEVHARVRAKLPTISLATVYNCLEALVQCQIVRAVNFERGPTRYCPNLKPHAHFRDEQSGKAYDIDLPPDLMERMKAILPVGYEVSSVDLIFRGTIKSEAAPAPLDSDEAAKIAS